MKRLLLAAAAVLAGLAPAYAQSPPFVQVRATEAAFTNPCPSGTVGVSLDTRWFFWCPAGTWLKLGPAGAAGTGDMARADYDSDSDNQVNAAEALAANGANCPAGQAALGVDAAGAAEGCWTPGTGGGDMTKAVYDTNADNKVDTAAAADSASGLACTTCVSSTEVDFNYAGAASKGGAASTATALASNPSDCGANQYATTIDASGNLTCSQVSGSQVSGAVATATALAANGSNCSAGQYAAGVDASGNAEGCATPPGGGDMAKATYDTDADSTVDSADGLTCSTCVSSSEVDFNYAGAASKGGAATTATALAANGGNCSAGQAPLGVDAAGAVEGCWTPGNMATGTYDTDADSTVDKAEQLAGNGSNCSAGQAALGVDASGNAEGCWTPTGSGDMTKAAYDTDADNQVNAAEALAANGTNCSAGQAALGVDASGNAEGCWTPTGSGDMTKATYDTDNDSTVDNAEAADTATVAGGLSANDELNLNPDADSDGTAVISAKSKSDGSDGSGVDLDLDDDGNVDLEWRDGYPTNYGKGSFLFLRPEASCVDATCRTGFGWGYPTGEFSYLGSGTHGGSERWIYLRSWLDSNGDGTLDAAPFNVLEMEQAVTDSNNPFMSFKLANLTTGGATGTPAFTIDFDGCEGTYPTDATKWPAISAGENKCLVDLLTASANASITASTWDFDGTVRIDGSIALGTEATGYDLGISSGYTGRWGIWNTDKYGDIDPDGTGGYTYNDVPSVQPRTRDITPGDPYDYVNSFDWRVQTELYDYTNTDSVTRGVDFLAYDGTADANGTPTTADFGAIRNELGRLYQIQQGAAGGVAFDADGTNKLMVYAKVVGTSLAWVIDLDRDGVVESTDVCILDGGLDVACDGTADSSGGGPTTDDAVLVGNGTGSDSKVIPDCDGDGSTLGYDQGTNAFTCGDDDSGGASTQVDIDGDGTREISFDDSANRLDIDPGEDGTADGALGEVSSDVNGDGTSEKYLGIRYGNSEPSGVADPLRPLKPTAYVDWFYDCLDPSVPAHVYVRNGTTGSSVATVNTYGPNTSGNGSSVWGTCHIAPGTSAGNDVALGMVMNTATGLHLPSKFDQLEVRALNSTTLDTKRVIIGGIKTNGNNDYSYRQSGAFFYCAPGADIDDDGTASDDAEDDNWWTVTTNGNTLGASECLIDGDGACGARTGLTAKDTGVECDSSETAFKVYLITYDGTDWKFYIDGTLESTHNASTENGPQDTSSSTKFGVIGWIVEQTSTTASINHYVDYVWYRGRR